MINYYFDNSNELKPYTFQTEANEDTFPPDNALRVEPEFKDGFWPCVKGKKWVLIEDNREKIAYNTETKEPITIDYLGEVKEGFTLLEPFDFCKWDGKKWKLDDNLKVDAITKSNQLTKGMLLAEATQQIAIFQDAIDSDMAEDGDEDKLKTWKKYRILLNRIDINQLEIVWPSKP